jgi:hypothetical protein
MWQEEMHRAGGAGAEASWILFIAEIDLGVHKIPFSVKLAV